ncbi:MAG: hypothetical protein R2834_03165 [Rhodothermales bacterium]
MEESNMHGVLEIILFLLWLVLIWLFWSRRKKETGGGGDTPRPPAGTKQVSIGLDANSGRWQIQNAAGGGLAPPIVARPGDVVTWTNPTSAQIDIQFPKDSLFELGGAPNAGGEPIDGFVVVVPAGATLRLPVSRKALHGTYEYAFWVREAGSATGYAVGGSPPRIIIEKA